jgi:DNA-directed RNA polymerase II subunit RPB9
MSFLEEQAPKKKTRQLKFCPESNDLLYPREDKETQRLVLYCKNCGYEDRELVPEEDYCVYSNDVTTEKEKTIILMDVRADPTLPRTRDVTCPQCQHHEAVFFSANTESGMTLYFECVSCGNKWRDYV